MAEAQAELSADNDIPEWTHSSGVVLTDTVASLQREVEYLRSDSMFNHTGETPTSPQGSRRTIFTSTKVPRFAGMTSWEQYRQVFDASRTGGCADCTLWFAGTTGGLSATI